MLKRIARPFFMAALVAGLAFLIITVNSLTQPEYDPTLNIAFIGTSESADCIVVWQKDFAMMIDTGEAQDKDAILSFLEARKIKKLDYLVLSHPDKDHIGSASAIVNAVSVVSAIEPLYQKKNKLNTSLYETLESDGVKIVIPIRSMRFFSNNITLTVIPPMKKSYKDNNDFSLAVYLQHGNVKMLFPGDAGDQRLSELMLRTWDKPDLYKLPRHGAYSQNSLTFLGELRPVNTVVTAKSASNRMTAEGDSVGTKWHYTVDNNLTFQSDGKTLSVTTAS